MSVVTYSVGSIVGAKFDNIVSNITDGIKNVVLREGAHDALSGIIGGFAWGSGISILNGDNIGDALGEGFVYGIQGAIFNGLNGLNRGFVLNQKEIKQLNDKCKETQINQYCLEDHASSEARFYVDPQGQIIDVLPTKIDILEHNTIPKYRHDGIIFHNYEGLAPWYVGNMTEWVVPSRNSNIGSVRIVTIGNRLYLTTDHYKSFVRIR